MAKKLTATEQQDQSEKVDKVFDEQDSNEHRYSVSVTIFEKDEDDDEDEDED